MFESISMPEFEQLMKQEQLNILDVRESHEHKRGYISGAILLPLSILGEHLDKLDSNVKYFVICHSGNRSLSVCRALSSRGFSVVNVMGGMSSWRGDLEMPRWLF